MEMCTRCRIRVCLKCKARKNTHQTVRWSTLSLPVPNGPGVYVAIKYFGPLTVTARGTSYIVMFTDRFSRHAGMYAVTAAELTVELTDEGSADILVNK